MTTRTPDTSTLISRFARLFKSIPERDLADISDVIDLWSEPGGPHRNPPAAKIVVGPPERASGGGGEAMVRDYSTNLTPQEGISEMYREFSAMLGTFGKSIEKHERTLGALMSIFGDEVARKAVPSADTFAGKALIKISKAKSELRRAELSDNDEDGKTARSGHLSAATELLAAAKRLLAKAPEYVESGDEDEDEVEKAVAQLRSLSKALSDAKDAAEDEEAGEGEGKAAKKATFALKDIEQALAGLKALPQTINGMLDTIAGRSMNPVAPIMSKGGAPVLDIRQRIEQAVDAGELSDIHELRAASLAGQFEAAKAGKIPMRDFECNLSQSGAEIRQLFSA